jgi:hypothetical protein
MAAVAREREMWLAAVTELLTRHTFVAGGVAAGSLGQGPGDGYSDVDLVVEVDATTPSAVLADPVAVLPVPGTVLYTRPKPRNAPAGGAYLAICVELAGLPVLVDLYLWPAATAAVPAGGRVLYARTELPRSGLGFMARLDRHRSADTTGADPGHPAVLLLVQLAAKYHARGDDRRHGIHQQLHIRRGGASPARPDRPHPSEGVCTGDRPCHRTDRRQSASPARRRAARRRRHHHPSCGASGADRAAGGVRPGRGRPGRRVRR